MEIPKEGNNTKKLKPLENFVNWISSDVTTQRN